MKKAICALLAILLMAGTTGGTAFAWYFEPERVTYVDANVVKIESYTFKTADQNSAGEYVPGSTYSTDAGIVLNNDAYEMMDLLERNNRLAKSDLNADFGGDLVTLGIKVGSELNETAEKIYKLNEKFTSAEYQNMISRILSGAVVYVAQKGECHEARNVAAAAEAQVKAKKNTVGKDDVPDTAAYFDLRVIQPTLNKTESLYAYYFDLDGNIHWVEYYPAINGYRFLSCAPQYLPAQEAYRLALSRPLYCRPYYEFVTEVEPLFTFDEITAYEVAVCCNP